jgi:hypothetical protein
MPIAIVATGERFFFNLVRIDFSPASVSLIPSNGLRIEF